MHVCDQDIRALAKGNDIRYDLVVHTLHDAASNDLFWKWIKYTKPRSMLYVSGEHVYSQDLQQEPCRLTEDQAESSDEITAMSLGGKVIRPFQVYGEGSRGPFDEVRRMVVGKMDPLRVPGCGRVFDFVHVDDVVSAGLSVVSDSADGPINVCTGAPTAMDELAELMCEASEWKPGSLVCDGDLTLFFRCGDTTKMNKIYSVRTSLVDGIAKSLSQSSNYLH